MFTTQYSTGEMANIAERDMEDYFDYSVALSPLLREHLKNAQNAACQIDPQFGESREASRFLSRFLLCAERRQDELTREVRVEEFLVVLARFWNRFTSPPDGPSVVRVPPGLVSFARFVARSRTGPVQRKLVVLDTKAAGIDLHGRDSWLILSDNVSYILLDYDGISKRHSTSTMLEGDAASSLSRRSDTFTFTTSGMTLESSRRGTRLPPRSSAGGLD